MSITLRSSSTPRYRRWPRAAAAGTIALALVLPLTGPAQAGDSGYRVGSTALVDVSVATLWRAPGIHRRSDRPSLMNPVDLVRWNRSMRSAADRRWLVGNVQTQALYAQRVLVTARKGKWIKVAVPDEPDSQDPRGYPGWLPRRQLQPPGDVPIVRDDSNYVVVLAKRATVRVAKGPVRVSYGTRLAVPVPAEDDTGPGWVRVLTPDGPGSIRAEDVGPPLEPSAASILDQGRRFLGLRYTWGGLSAWGFDCSGLIWNLFRAHGMTIPRDADPQFRSGRPVSRKNLKPADLIFWGDQSYVHHVALYVGRGKMMEAPDSAGHVRIVPVRWREYAGARRYLP